MTVNGQKVLTIPTAVMISVITFLVGGYLGDWSASAQLMPLIKNNTETANATKEKAAVMENSVQNIELMVREIKEDVKEIKKNQ
jgi:translation initiation factor 2B subunit (eIF-2B alpha/beta/delta family)